MNESIIINTSKRWISNVVIHHGLCPFAKREFINNQIHYEVIDDLPIEQQLEMLVLHCRYLDQQLHISTSLLIYPKSFLQDFDAYLDFYAIADAIIDQQGYRGIYQLASFHPQYCFAETPIDDASNFTNRSPYPMLHILREDSLEKALVDYPNPETIPDHNIHLAQSLGRDYFEQQLKKCFDN